MTQIHLAKSAGFCFGVSRAVDRVNALLDAGRRVCTLGPIIHNPQGIYYGGQVAAPVVRQLFENVLPYLDKMDYN